MNSVLHPLVEVCQAIVRTSGQAAVLVGIILAIQWLLRNRLSPAWRYGLWCLLVARLVLPVSLESGLSIFNVVKLRREPSLATPVVQVPAPSDGARLIADPSVVIGTPGPGVRPPESDPSVVGVAVDGVAVPAQAAPLPGPLPIEWGEGARRAGEGWFDGGLTRLGSWETAAIIWLFGVLVFGIRLFWMNLRFRARLRAFEHISDHPSLGVLEECRAALRVRQRVELIESDLVQTPGVYGFWLKRLLVPEGTFERFDRSELRCIFLHELAHLRRRDLEVNWLAALLQVLYWFNPVIWFAFGRMRADRELATDALALSVAAPTQITLYGETIIRVLEGFSGRPALPGVVGIAENLNHIKQRMKAIAQFGAIKYWRWLAILLVLALSVGCLTDARSSGNAQYRSAALKAGISVPELLTASSSANQAGASNGASKTASPTEIVRSAIERLGSAANYSYSRRESADPSNSFSISSTSPLRPNSGHISRDGRMDISSRLQEAITGNPTYRILLVGSNGVIRFPGLEGTGQPWVPLAEIDSATPEKMRLLAALPTAPWYDQWLRDGTLQRRLTASVRNIRPPTVGAADLLSKLDEVRETTGRYEGTVAKAKAVEWLTNEGYSGDANNPLDIITCDATFSTSDGMLSKYEVEVAGTKPTYYGAINAPSVRYVPFSLKLTVEIFDVGESFIEVPAEAARKLPQLLTASAGGSMQAEASNAAVPFAALVTNPAMSQPGVTGQPVANASSSNEPEFYPWSETSEFVRVPRSLFRHGALPVEFVPQEAIETLRMTPGEVKTINEAMSDTVHEYRVMEGQHLEAVPETSFAIYLVEGRAAVERYTFRFVPFPEAALALRRNLEDVVERTLGAERAKQFWQHPHVYMESRVSALPMAAPGSGETRSLRGRSGPSWIPTLSTFAKRVPPGPGRATAITYFSYQLRNTNSAQRIFLVRATHDGDMGGLGMSLEINEALDQYAPASMKPVLARWRKTIAETPGAAPSLAEFTGLSTPLTPSAANAPISVQATNFAVGSARWELGLPCVDLPKKLVVSLDFPGVTLTDDVSSTAAAIFGLTAAERKAVRELFAEMRKRFEQLERANCEPAASGFVIYAFVADSQALQLEWAGRLKRLLGENRGEMLAAAMRRSPPELPDFESDELAMPLIGPNWLHRGVTEVRFRITNPGLNLGRIDSQGAGGRGTTSVYLNSRGESPLYWRHLVTPDWNLIAPTTGP